MIIHEVPSSIVKIGAWCDLGSFGPFLFYETKISRRYVTHTLPLISEHRQRYYALFRASKKGKCVLEFNKA